MVSLIGHLDTSFRTDLTWVGSLCLVSVGAGGSWGPTAGSRARYHIESWMLGGGSTIYEDHKEWCFRRLTMN